MIFITAVLLIFGVASFLWGLTLSYVAWPLPHDRADAIWYMAVGMASVSGAIWIMTKI